MFVIFSALQGFGGEYIPQLLRQCPQMLFGDELWKKIHDLVFVGMSTTRVDLQFNRFRARHFQNSDSGAFTDSLLGQLIVHLPRGFLYMRSGRCRWSNTGGFHGYLPGTDGSQDGPFCSDAERQKRRGYESGFVDSEPKAIANQPTFVDNRPDFREKE
jgi:hypothetical protein